MKKLLLLLLLPLSLVADGSYNTSWSARLPPASPVAMTGTANDLTLFTYTFPAAPTLTAGGCIDLKIGVARTTGSGSVTYKLTWGAQTFTLGATSVAGTLVLQGYVCNRDSSTTSQDLAYFIFGTAATGVATSTQDTSTALTITLKANAASGNSVTPQFFYLRADR